MKHIAFILLFSICYLENAVSQQTSYYFKHYNINSKLSQNTVMSIFQDSKGFIWFGTKNGLNRFDGCDFKVYQRGNSSNDLKNSMIYCITEDRHRTLWIATDKGISLYDPFTENFKDFNQKTLNGLGIEGPVSKIIIDTLHDRTWILTGPDLFLYQNKEDKLYHLNDKFSTYKAHNPSALYVDSIGVAYIGYPRTGIFSYDAETDKITLINQNNNTPTAICSYKENSLLLGTMNSGAYIIDKTTGNSRKIAIDKSIDSAIIDSNLFVRDIRQISESEYWMGTESGIYILKDDITQHIMHEEFNSQSLSDNAIYSIFKDKEGGIWIGSYFGGVDYIPTHYSYFENFYPIAYKNSVSGCRVREFVSDAQGNLWIATEDHGLNYYDKNKGRFTHISTQTKPLNISFTNIQCLNLSENKLWIGTFSKGIDVLDLKTGQRRHYERTDQPNSIDNNDIFAIYTDKRNTIWIGSSSSVYTYVPEIDGFQPFDKIRGVFISDILEDKNGFIWFATYNRGAIRYNPQSGKIKEFRYDEENPYSLCYDRITCIFEDSKQHLWFGSEDGGFCRYNDSNESFTRITTQHGLPSNVIYTILEDDNNHLWLSTNNGLVDFNPQNMTIEAQYNFTNGLQSKQFNYNSGIKTEDGTLYFGSINGFVAFNPKNFRINKNKYSVALTDFYIFNQEVKVDSVNKILDKAMPYAETIHLNYDQATFSFSFSSLNYSTEANGKYAYQLEGIDPKWNYIDNITRISYNSIPPGNYTFRIKYSKDGHEWSEEDTQIKINIIPPLWRTSWAYSLYALIVISILFSIIRFYMNRKRKQIEEKMAHQEQMRKEEIYKAKIDFFTDIAHEIRTPITLIKAPLDYILNSQPNEREVKENLITMERNTDRLLVLVNQLLDFRKIESKAFTLSLKVRNINALVANTYSRFVPTARQKQLETQLECPAEAILASVDEEAITKVCSNLFNNAIKYSATYIKVRLAADEDSQHFRITVKNDGKPIPPELRQNIFEAFFQIKDAGSPAVPGSGIGLTLASSLVQLHNGKLYLDDNAEDISFVVEIPINISGEHPEVIDVVPPVEKEVNEEKYELSLTSKTFVSTKEAVLIVEDNEELRTFLNNQLSKYYQVFIAKDGVEALEILKAEMISLIVSDVMMPLMDGLELCKAIKSNLETCHIPIILLTAKSTLSNKIEGLKTGADAYIEKPFAMPYLLAQIENLLESRMKLRQNFANSPYIATNTMAQNKADEDFLNKMTEIIRQNIESEAFNVDNLAEEMHMSRTSLHRKIKGITEMTPGDFIRIIRLKRAAELLSEGDYLVSEICMLVGIRSLSYFSKSFQKQFGVLPKDFVKSHGKAPKQ